MTAIEQIQAIPLDKITNEGLKTELTSYLEEYAQAKDKAYFLKVNTENTQTLLGMIKASSPDLLIDPEHPCFELIQQSNESSMPKNEKHTTTTPKPTSPKAQSKPKNEEKKSKPKLSTTELKAQIKDLKTELAACRRGDDKSIKNPVRKQAPKVSKEVYDKTVKHLRSIINLIPDSIEKDQQKMSAIKQMMLSLHRKLVKTYEIDTEIAKDGKLGLSQQLEKIITPLNNN